jgi:hypothetical protein
MEDFHGAPLSVRQGVEKKRIARETKPANSNRRDYTGL